MRLRWTELALGDLKGQVAVIAQDRPRTARKVAAAIREAVGALRSHPHLGRVVPEFQSQDIRELIVQRWRIVYRVTEEVRILRVWHSRRSLAAEDLEAIDS